MFKYPWGNLQGLNLAWFLEKFNQLLEDWATAEAGIDGALDDEIQKAEDALSDVFDARDAAAASATAAAGSATSAGASATAAQNSATAAASSATLANTKATAAGLSEAAAAQSASDAAASASAANTNANAAAASAANAITSASTAGTNANAAATSAANAAASAARAEEIEESIPEDYTMLSNDVTELKTSVVNNTAPSPEQALVNSFYSKNFTFTYSGRIFGAKNGILFMTYSSGGAANRGLWFSNGVFNTISSTISGAVPPKANCLPISKIQNTTRLKLFTDNEDYSGVLIGLFFVSIDNNGNVTVLSSYRSNAYNYLSVTEFAIPTNATHFALCMYTGSQPPNDTALNIYLGIDAAPTTQQIQAIVLENIGG